MNIFHNKTSIVIIIVALFYVYAVNVSSATTEAEDACLKFVDGHWFTAENAHTSGMECYMADNSFRANGAIIRTGMILDFWAYFAANPPTFDDLKKDLGKDIIDNPNLSNLKVGDEQNSGYISWQSLKEVTLGDYSIVYQYGSYGNDIRETVYYFIVNSCTVKLSVSGIPESNKGIDKLNYYDYVAEIALQKAKEVTDKLKNEPLCQIGYRSSEIISPSPAEDAPEVEALIGKRPLDDDLQLSSSDKILPVAKIAKLDGHVEFQLLDGTRVSIKKDDTLSSEGILQTQDGSMAEVHFLNSVISVGPLTQLNIKELNLDPKSYQTEFDLDAGGVRFKTQEGDFETDMKVMTQNTTASSTGADFSVSYDKNTGLTMYEVYNGNLLAISSLTGKQKIISSRYNQPIKRLEVAKNGQMTEQVAIPKDEWQVQQTEQPQTSENRNSKSVLVLLLVIGVVVFVLYKKGKLQPISKKVLALIRGNNSKSF